MFRLACPIPHDIVVACSGGPDSMALLSFCQGGKKNITVLHIDHGTPHAKDARELVEAYCKHNALSLVVRKVPSTVEHTENSWREFRLGVYREFTKNNLWVATAHHLDDAIEWYLMTALHGGPKFMQPVDAEHKLMKPFLYTEKDQLFNWCNYRKVSYIIDPTNIGQENTRAILRESVMPALLKIHPGMKSSIRNKMLGQ